MPSYGNYMAVMPMDMAMPKLRLCLYAYALAMPMPWLCLWLCLSQGYAYENRPFEKDLGIYFENGQNFDTHIKGNRNNKCNQRLKSII